MSEILEEVVNSLSINLREMIKSISKDNKKQLVLQNYLLNDSIK